MSAKLKQADYETLADFRYALRRFLRFSEEAALALGLEARQHQALLAVRGFPGGKEMTLGDLAERLQIRHHSAVGLVDRLTAQNLLARKPGTKDRREVNISVTARGNALLEKLTAAHREELRRTGPELRALLESF